MADTTYKITVTCSYCGKEITYTGEEFEKRFKVFSFPISSCNKYLLVEQGYFSNSREMVCNPRTCKEFIKQYK